MTTTKAPAAPKHWLTGFCSPGNPPDSHGRCERLYTWHLGPCVCSCHDEPEVEEPVAVMDPCPLCGAGLHGAHLPGCKFAAQAKEIFIDGAAILPSVLVYTPAEAELEAVAGWLHERIVGERRAGVDSLWSECPESLRGGWRDQARAVLQVAAEARGPS